jgi:hypothetical protein
MPYNAQFDLRGTQIKSNFNQITQYDTSSGNWFLGEGQQVDVSSSYTISASNATNAQNAYYSLLSSNTTSASYAQSSSITISSSWSQTAGILTGIPGPYYGQPFINIIGNSGSLIQISETGDIIVVPAGGHGVTLDSAVGTIENDGTSGVYLFSDAGATIVLGIDGKINLKDVSGQGQHFDGLGNVYFDNNVTASYFAGDGFNLINLSWSLNSDTSSVSLSSSYAISASYAINSDTSSISISSSYAYTSSIANTIPYSSSVQNFDNTDNLLTGSMYLQVGPPTFLFVYDGTAWRSSSLA